jgi:rhamnose transport system substrate-binding protein
MNPRTLRAAAFAVFAFGWLAACDASKPAASTDPNAPLRIAVVAKQLGSGYSDAIRKGGEQASAELGKVQVIFTGPSTPTAEGQIEVLNTLIAQQVNAIAVSANDPDALVPTLKRAMQRGIKVISFDSAVSPEGRVVHLAPSSDVLVGETCLQLAQAAAPGGKGKIAILSASATATNQNAWIAAMRSALPRYPELQLVATVYGDDLSDKSYREALALLKRFPDLAVIVAPTSIGIVAAAKAIEDEHLTGKVFVTGLGLPSELIGHVNAGSVKSFALWNPIDLGYSAVTLATHLARGAKTGPGVTVPLGRIGSVTFDQTGTGPMSKPFIFDGANTADFAKIF